MRNRIYPESGELNPFLKKICAILKDKGLSPSSVSSMAGLGPSTLSNLIKRNNVPTVATLMKVCTVLDITMSSLIKDIEDDNPELFKNASLGAKRHDPMSLLKKQILDDFQALPVKDKQDTLRRMQKKYGICLEEEE